MNDLSDLSYTKAKKSISKRFTLNDPKKLYSLYFYLEQHGAENCLKYIYSLSSKFNFSAEHELIKARFHLFHPGDDADLFFNQKETKLTGSDFIYFHFLASAYFDKTLQNEKKKFHSDFCLKHYDSIGDYNRYMTSLAHTDNTNIYDLTKVLDHSIKSKQAKAEGVSLLGLAKKHASDHDHENALYYLQKAKQCFLQKHHDPRRLFEVKIATIKSYIELNKLDQVKLGLKNLFYKDTSSLKRTGKIRLEYIKRKHNLDLPSKAGTVDYKILELISQKATSREDLKDYLWPNHRSLITESIDERLRSSVYRLKKHYNIPINKAKDEYSLAI